MTWTLETKITDRAPLKRGDEWTQDVCHIIRDERGRYIVSATEQDHPALTGVMLSPAELQAAVRLIVAAPALLAALQALLVEVHGPISAATLIQCNAAIAMTFAGAANAEVAA